MVEGVEGAVGRDGELEAVADAGVLDRDGDGVLARVPEQEDVEAVALAGGELASRVSAVRVVMGSRPPVQLVAVVRSAT